MSALWRVATYGTDWHPPSDRYAWDNRRRGGADVVFQLTEAGELLFRDTQAEHRVLPQHAVLFDYPLCGGWAPRRRPGWPRRAYGGPSS